MAARGVDVRQRLKDRSTIICASGYVSELERRGLVGADDDIRAIPFAALSQPDLVRLIHEDFIHCGSDAVVAFVPHSCESSEEEIMAVKETMKIAREVADKNAAFVAGIVTSTGLGDLDDSVTIDLAKQMLQKQIKRVVEGGADLLFGEKFNGLNEAKLALDCMKQQGNGLPIVMTLTVNGRDTTTSMTNDDESLPKALRTLEELGADVVGLAGVASPSTTILSILTQVKEICKGPIAVVPDAYRNVSTLTEEPVLCTAHDLQDFFRAIRKLGVQFLGTCCGGHPSSIRIIADTYERQTPASKFAPDVSKCYINISKPTPVQTKIRLWQLSHEYYKTLA